jgi:hypothetical protein
MTMRKASYPAFFFAVLAAALIWFGGLAKGYIPEKEMFSWAAYICMACFFGPMLMYFTDENKHKDRVRPDAPKDFALTTGEYDYPPEPQAKPSKVSADRMRRMFGDD